MARPEIALQAVEHLRLIGLGGEGRHGSQVQCVRGLLEGDALARGAGAQAIGRGIDHLGAGEPGQRVEDRPGEHIAASRRLVLQDTVVEQVDRASLVGADQGAVGRAGKAGTGLGKPDEFGELGKGYVGADLAGSIEERFGG